MMQNLSSISALYLYNGPAPNGHGTQAPKVAESVLRARRYNLKSQKRRARTVGQYEVNDPMWTNEDGPFPFIETSGNWHRGGLTECSKKTFFNTTSKSVQLQKKLSRMHQLKTQIYLPLDGRHGVLSRKNLYHLPTHTKIWPNYIKEKLYNVFGKDKVF